MEKKVEKNVILLNDDSGDSVYFEHTFWESCVVEGDYWNVHPIEFSLSKYEKIPTQKEITFADKKLTKTFRDILALLRDPQEVARNLKPLNDELAKRMKENKINYDDKDFPNHLIAGNGYLIPGPPPFEDYKPRKQGRLLNSLLLEREQLYGINLGGVPKLTGSVDEKEVNELVKSGYIFAEDVQFQNLIHHSKYAHRLVFEVIRNAVKEGLLTLECDSGMLTQKDLLELMVSNHNLEVGVNGGKNAWRRLLDTAEDQTAFALSFLDYLDDEKTKFREITTPENFTFSSRSPFVFNSLLTCFGAELGLGDLQHYLLNSHWKEAARMVSRARDCLNEEKDIEMDQTEELDMSFSNLYVHSMKCLAFQSYTKTGGIFDTYFTLDSKKDFLAEKYEKFSEEHLLVKRKTTEPKDFGSYASIEAYISWYKSGATSDIDQNNPGTKVVGPNCIQRLCGVLSSWREPKVHP